ncbi:MAG: methyl-accepting chemotaxis protein [Chloroflexi bacterium]|nr:methyl-accepting chemotaxis protein [Chloroflexota bacterium]
MAVLSVVAFNNISSLTRTADQVEHTHEVLEVLTNILGDLKDAETGQRGYVITREDRYLEPYNAALANVQAKIADVRELTIDNPAQTRRIDALLPLVDDKFAELLETIDLRRNETFEAARDVVLTDAGKSIMDNIRVLMDALDKEERDLLVIRSEAAQDAASTAKIVLIGGTVGAVLLMAGIAFFLTRGLTTGITQIGNAMKRIAVGDLGTEVSVKSSDEVGEMAQSYDEMKSYLQEMSAATQLIGGGDLSVIVKPKSDGDVLGNALKGMVAGLRDVVGQVTNTANEVATASEQLASVAEQAGTATRALLSRQRVSQRAPRSRNLRFPVQPNPSNNSVLPLIRLHREHRNRPKVWTPRPGRLLK